MKDKIVLEKLNLQLAVPEEVTEVLQLYNELLDTLDQDVNYPKWTKGLYPDFNYLDKACQNQELYIFKMNNQIVGAVVLNSHTVPEYKAVDWTIPEESGNVLIMHTFAIADKLRCSGLGLKAVEMVKKLAKEKGKKAIHLDTIYGNYPAARFYEKAGFTNLGEYELNYKETPERRFTLFEYNL